MNERVFMDLNRKYVDIWNKYREQYGQNNQKDLKDIGLNYWPYLYTYEKSRQRPILFVGFNPSLDDKNDEYKQEIRIVGKFDDDNVKKKKIIQLEKKYISDSLCDGVEKGRLYGYYMHFPNISRNVLGKENRCNWIHIDLLPIRNHNQGQVIKNLHLHKNNVFCDINSKYKEFIEELIEQFFYAIPIIDPVAIVVVNAFVSGSIIRITDSTYEKIKEVKKCARYFIPEGYEFQIDMDTFDREGIRKLKASGNEYPVFLSSMLTSQRALDVPSRERLIWHMKKVIRNESDMKTL